MVQEPTNVRNDSQNVHDGELQNAAKSNLEAIENTTNIVDEDTNVIKKIFETHLGLSSTEKKHIVRVLDSINHESKHSKYDRTEGEILNTVWARINDPVNTERRDELILSLGHQLASGVEHDYVVCSTGKIMRMVGSLEALDAQYEEVLVPLKPRWAIEREIADSAAKIRTDVLQESSQEDRGKYETGEHAELTELMRQRLLEKCTNDYVNPGIINSIEAMRVIVEPYLDSL